jgi:hypothetical protein
MKGRETRLGISAVRQVRRVENVTRITLAAPDSIRYKHSRSHVLIG